MGTIQEQKEVWNLGFQAARCSKACLQLEDAVELPDQHLLCRRNNPGQLVNAEFFGIGCNIDVANLMTKELTPWLKRYILLEKVVIGEFSQGVENQLWASDGQLFKMALELFADSIS